MSDYIKESEKLMKKLRFIGLIFLINIIFGAGFTPMVSENDQDIQILFSQGEIQFTTIGEFKRIPSGTFGTTTEMGMPELPLFSTLVQVEPDKEYAVSFSITQSSTVSDILIYPVQSQVSKKAHEAINHMNEPFYSSQNKVYPESPLTTSERFVMRDLNVLNIQVIPFRYSPSIKDLEIIESMDIIISVVGDRQTQYSTDRLPSKAFDPLYSTLVVNYENRDREEEFQQPAVLYICGGNSENNNWFQQLVNWRHKRGYVVYTASVNDIGNSTNSIKNYIENAYESFNPPPEFVGLVGDAGGSYNVPTFDECWGHDWGGCEGDFPYTQLDGNDFFPEVFVGRISVNSTSELGTVINKIIHYEKATYMSTMPDYYERAALIGDPSSSGMSTIITNEYIENIMSAYDMEDIRTNYGDGGYASWMRNRLEEGMLYMNYRGYVGVSGFGGSDINNANNGHKLPFATFLTCGTGDFASTSISEDFLRAGSISNPKGGVAAVGTATLSTHTMFNNIVAMGIYDGIFSQNTETVGAAVAHGKLVMYNTYPTNPSNWVSAFTQWNNLMGDPVTHLWTDTPKSIQLIYDGSIPIGTNFIDIKVLNEGIPLSDAMVTLLKGNDELFVSGYSNGSGDVTLPIHAFITTGTASITVTKKNYKPYEGELIITNSGSIANVDPSLEFELNELSGNNDGLLNPGESIELRVPVRNYGQSILTNVSATLTTESELVEIMEDECSYGSSLSPGETSFGTGFSFSISPEAEEMEDLKLRIRLDSEFAVNIGVSEVVVPVYGVDLNVVGYDINSGNVIILEPGIASDIQITLSNDGSISTSELMGELNFYGSAVQIYDGDGHWNPIEPGANQTSAGWFTIRPSLNVINGSVYSMKLWVYSDEGYQNEISFPIYVGAVSQTDPLGPDEYGYFMYDSEDTDYDLAPEYDWIEINPSQGGNGSSLNLSDDGYGNFYNSIAHVSLPFPFSFYGDIYESITVCTNGWISFGHSELESFRNYPVPGAGGPSPMVAVFWDDLKTSGNGNVYTYADPNNEYFVIEWYNMKTENYNSPNTFELILYNEEVPPFNDGVMKMQYHTFNNTSSGDFSGYSPRHGSYCTVGLENKMGNVGLQYTFDNGYSPAAMPLGNQTAILVTTQPTINMTEVAVPMEVNENWNLIGLPADVENGNYMSIFPDAISNTLYTFEDGYQLTEYMEMGHGYWLRFPESGMHLITGIRMDEMSLDLVEGWNLISGISFNIDLNMVADPNDILVPNTLYGFGTNGYQGYDELDPGKGYWLRAYEAGTIFLSAVSGARVKESPSILANPSWISVNGQKLFFDEAVSSTEALQFSLPPKPPVGAFDARFSGDTKLCSEDCVIEIMTQNNLWIEYYISSEDDWVLTDESSDEKIILASGVSNSGFELNQTSQLTLRKNNDLVPDNFSLLPAFPNPFNPETTLKFSLPNEGKLVALNIINIKGQNVKSLISGELSQGIYTVKWNGTDWKNERVGAGVYFAVLSQESETVIQKLVLLK